MTAAPSLDDLFAVMSAVSFGQIGARVTLPESPELDDARTRLGVALNLVLDDLGARVEAAERANRRLRILTDVAHELAEATQDLGRLLDTVARRLAEVMRDQCVVRLVSDDGRALLPVAVHGADEDAASLLRGVLSEPVQLDLHPVARRVHETGEPFVVAKFDVAHVQPGTTPRYYEWARRVGVHSVMMLALRHRGASLGQILLMRYRPESPSFDEQDPADLPHAVRVGRSRRHRHRQRPRDRRRAGRAQSSRREGGERASEGAEARFARLSETGLLGVMVHSVGDTVRLLEINDAFASMLGYTREEVLSGRVVWKALTPVEWVDDDVTYREWLRTSGIRGLREKEYFHKDGRRVPVLIGSAMLEEEGNHCASLSFSISRSARQRRPPSSEWAASAPRTPSSALSSRRPPTRWSSPTRKIGSCWSTTASTRSSGTSGTIWSGSPSSCSSPCRSAVRKHPSRRSRCRSPIAIRRLRATGLEVTGRRKDGTTIPIEVGVSPLQTDEGLLVSRAIRDLTERKRAEEQRARLAAIVESSDDAIIGKTLEGIVTSWNEGARRLFGYEAGEILGRSISVLIPRDREHEEPTILATIARGAVLRFDTDRLRKDGATHRRLGHDVSIP